MKKSIAINIAKIGQNLNITFGRPPSNNLNSIHFNDILTEWTQEFLKSTSLTTLEEQCANIKAQLKISKEHNMYRVEGEIEFSPLLECVRSLTLFREKITTQVNAFFVQDTSSAYKNSNISRYLNNSEPNDEVELSESDLETYSFSNNFIELDEFIIDSLYLALPELPLCREDCKGLCPSCGTELNEVQIEGQLIRPNHAQKCTYSSH
ncbi:YceD family protein [Fluviispira sanaruensis]|uniref:DUF177 domain-containing protein n=1 Tax=Fluviispira sanaruensis TaxID=2493639 RepID=A0A4P2VW76_FLUSA|nr:DUF177 domain-containing protein [Fluviispira sanaruensis]BBH53202.1 hypothetical protein JCM31447_16450 [Fluviispira sanaruensis]